MASMNIDITTINCGSKQRKLIFSLFHQVPYWLGSFQLWQCWLGGCHCISILWYVRFKFHGWCYVKCIIVFVSPVKNFLETIWILHVHSLCSRACCPLRWTFALPTMLHCVSPCPCIFNNAHGLAVHQHKCTFFAHKETPFLGLAERHAERKACKQRHLEDLLDTAGPAEVLFVSVFWMDCSLLN